MDKRQKENFDKYGVTCLKDLDEYNIYHGIIQRCENPKYRLYKYYGDRGIKMCKEWRESFHMFYADVGKRPSKEHSLDRIDNDGDYCPGNCQWVTQTEQGRNKRNNRILHSSKDSMCVTAWAEVLGVSPYVLTNRIRYGWCDTKVLLLPPKKVSRLSQATKKQITELKNQGLKQREIARKLKISESSVSKTLNS